jgi:hypothetical protein
VKKCLIILFEFFDIIPKRTFHIKLCMKTMGIGWNGMASAMRIIWHENAHPYLKGFSRYPPINDFLPNGNWGQGQWYVTSDLVRVTNVGSFPRYISKSEFAMYSSRAAPLLFVSVLPHATWCEFASQPIIIGILLTSEKVTTALSIALGGGLGESKGR